MTKIPVQIVQGLAIFLGLVMVANFVLLIMHRIDWTGFWLTTGVLFVAAKWGVPWLKKQSE